MESPASDQPDPGKMFHPEPRKEKEPSGHNTLCEMKKKGKHGKVNKLAGRVGHSEESEDSHSKSSEEESSEEDERPRKKKKRRRHDGWKEKHRSKHRIHTQDSDFSGSEEEEWQRHHRHRASNHREPHREGDRYEEERNKVSHKKERWYGHHHHYLTDGQPVKRSRQQQQSPSPDRSQRKHRRSYSESDSGPEEQRRQRRIRFGSRVRKSIREKIFCICRMPNDKTKGMTECTRCFKWYHNVCVQLQESEESLRNVQWICTACRSLVKIAAQ